MISAYRMQSDWSNELFGFKLEKNDIDTQIYKLYGITNEEVREIEST